MDERLKKVKKDKNAAKKLTAKLKHLTIMDKATKHIKINDDIKEKITRKTLTTTRGADARIEEDNLIKEFLEDLLIKIEKGSSETQVYQEIRNFISKEKYNRQREIYLNLLKIKLDTISERISDALEKDNSIQFLISYFNSNDFVQDKVSEKAPEKVPEFAKSKIFGIFGYDSDDEEIGNKKYYEEDNEVPVGYKQGDKPEGFNKRGRPNSPVISKRQIIVLPDEPVRKRRTTYLKTDDRKPNLVEFPKDPFNPMLRKPTNALQNLGKSRRSSRSPSSRLSPVDSPIVRSPERSIARSRGDVSPMELDDDWLRELTENIAKIDLSHHDSCRVCDKLLKSEKDVLTTILKTDKGSEFVNFCSMECFEKGQTGFKYKK